MSALRLTTVSLFAAFAVVSLSGLSGCGKLKEMLSKEAADAAADVVVAAAPSAPVVAAVEDAGTDAAPTPVAEDFPAPEAEDQRANRDIGFGNFRDELGKLEKEMEAAETKKK